MNRREFIGSTIALAAGAAFIKAAEPQKLAIFRPNERYYEDNAYHVDIADNAYHVDITDFSGIVFYKDQPIRILKTTKGDYNNQPIDYFESHTIKNPITKELDHFWFLYYGILGKIFIIQNQQPKIDVKDLTLQCSYWCRNESNVRNIIGDNETARCYCCKQTIKVVKLGNSWIYPVHSLPNEKGMNCFTSASRVL